MASSRTTITNSENQSVAFEFTNGLDGIQNLSTGLNLTSVNQSISGFYIIPLAAGDLSVVLVGQDSFLGETFTIPSAMVSANIGSKLPFKVKEVLATGTTLTSALIAW